MKFRKKPVVIEAIEFKGYNFDDVFAFVEMRSSDAPPMNWFPPTNHMEIETLEGNMKASPGDFIICGVNGEFYPCKPDIFEKSYEKVEEIRE